MKDGGVAARGWLVGAVLVMAVLLFLEIRTDINDWLILLATAAVSYVPVFLYFRRDPAALPARDPAPQDALADDGTARRRAGADAPEGTAAPTL